MEEKAEEKTGMSRILDELNGYVENRKAVGQMMEGVRSKGSRQDIRLYARSLGRTISDRMAEDGTFRRNAVLMGEISDQLEATEGVSEENKAYTYGIYRRTVWFSGQVVEIAKRRFDIDERKAMEIQVELVLFADRLIDYVEDAIRRWSDEIDRLEREHKETRGFVPSFLLGEAEGGVDRGAEA